MPENKETKVPEWIPEGADRRFFTTSIMSGVDAGGADGSVSRASRPKRRELSLEDYKSGVLAGDRTVLARAITLVESNAPAHFDLAQQLLAELLPHTGKAFRIGITGVPGAGKSTFIEAFGTMLCGDFGKRVAVLAVDPSSSLSGGSILGDKTRMENLLRCKNAFIRPSPSGGMLGGVARKSRETMLLCEAAGFDVILVETVGVGQSEVTVRSMTDFFLLIQLAAQGDDLQGIKKGVMELADGILVNKCDGNMVEKSNLKRAELLGVLHFLASPTPGWTPFCEVCSAVEGTGIRQAWELLEKFRRTVESSGVFGERRARQKIQWFDTLLEQEILREFYSRKNVERSVGHYRKLIASDKISVAAAVKGLLGEGAKAEK